MRTTLALIMFGLVLLGCSSSQQQGKQQESVSNGSQSEASTASDQNGAKKDNSSLNSTANSTPKTENFAGINNATDTLSPDQDVEGPINGATSNLAVGNAVPMNNGAMNSAPKNSNSFGTSVGTPNAAITSNVLGLGNGAGIGFKQITEPARANNAVLSDSKAAPSQTGLISKEVDLGPPHGTVQWVGYNYRKDARKLDIQIVTDGHPIYKIFQETNRARQPEVVVRFLNTDIRPKARRDLDASEFRSPVAYVRLRRDNIFRHTDVILTLRDSVQPKMLAKGSSIMLTFDIPDRWFGPEQEGDAPVAKVEIAPDANVMPVADPASEVPGIAPKTVIATYVDDPGKDEFKGVAPSAAMPLVPVSNSKELVPATNGVAIPQATITTPKAVVPVKITKPAAPIPQVPSTVAKPVVPMKAAAKPVMHVNASTVIEPKPQVQTQAQVPVNQAQKPVPQPPQQVVVPPAPQYPPQQVVVPPTPQYQPQPMYQQPIPMQQPMMAPQAIPIPQGVPGVVPQVQPFPGGIPGAQPPAAPSDDGAKGADKFQVRAPAKAKYIERRFSVAGVAQAGADFTSDIPAPASDSTSMPLDLSGTDPVGGGLMDPTSVAAPMSPAAAPTEIQGVEQTAVTTTAPAAPKKVMKFDFRDAAIGTVLRAISSESGLNFVMPPDVAARKITVSLNNIPWDVALKAVLEANRLGMEEIGPKIIRIDTLKTFVDDRDTQERARQATEALVPTKVLVIRLSYALADKIVDVIKEMMSKPSDQANLVQQRNYARFKIKADVRSNSLIIEATPVELAKLKALVERLDMPTPQVRISSRIVEVLAKAVSGLGISWGSPFNVDGGRGLGFGSLPFPNNLTSNFAVDPAFSGTPVGAASMKFGSINNVMALDLKIKMLESKEEAESLQSQDLMVEDNQKATIEAGSVDYFVIPASGDQSTSLTPVTYSTSLGVTPHITADGAVQMSLAITGDQPVPASAKGAAAGKLSRNLTTTMMRRSGDTAVIGGLYTTNRGKAVNGIPYLSDLPIIGALFRSTVTSDQRRDLLIMVTPTIVNQNSASPEQDGTAAIDSGMGPFTAGAQNGGASTGNMALDAQATTQGQYGNTSRSNNANSAPAAQQQSATQQGNAASGNSTGNISNTSSESESD